MEIVARMQYGVRPVLDSDLSFEGDKGLTKQSDAKDCDINAIFKRFERTGQLPDAIFQNPLYGDFSNVPDYQEALHIVRKAEEQFALLDVTIRNRFDNDPAKFLGFVQDPKNIDEMDKMGLLKPEAVKARREAEAAIAAENVKKLNEKAEADERKLIDKIKAELQK